MSAVELLLEGRLLGRVRVLRRQRRGLVAQILVTRQGSSVRLCDPLQRLGMQSDVQVAMRGFFARGT